MSLAPALLSDSLLPGGSDNSRTFVRFPLFLPKDIICLDVLMNDVRELHATCWTPLCALGAYQI